jgi:hypothetical protein
LACWPSGQETSSALYLAASSGCGFEPPCRLWQIWLRQQGVLRFSPLRGLGPSLPEAQAGRRTRVSHGREGCVEARW